MKNTGKQQKKIRGHWEIASCVVFCLYGGLGFALYSFYPEQETTAGEPPALMLEFAEEITAPSVENASDVIQQAMAEKSERQEEEEPVEETPPEVETPPSDMQEAAKPVEKREEKPKPVERREQDKKRKEQRHDTTRNDKRTQVASGAQIAAPRGDAYRAPRTSRTDGDNGRAVASWKSKVFNRIKNGVPGMDGYSGSPVVARVRFHFDSKGKITSANINASSGNARVDAYVLRKVKGLSRIPAPPEGAELVLTVPIKVERNR